MMILLRPAILVAGIVLAFVLFKVFVWLLNSQYLTNTIESVAHPRADSPEQIQDGVTRANKRRDERIQANVAGIERAKAENTKLKKL